MVMRHHIQNTYVPLHPSEISNVLTQGDQTQLLDGTESGYTFEFTDKPADAVPLGEDVGSIEVYFKGTDITDGADFGCRLWGYAIDGPHAVAELMAEISGVISEGIQWADSTAKLYADTLTVTSRHIKTFAAADSGNDRICKVAGDVVGLGWVLAEFYDITTAGNCISGKINAYMRTFN